MFMTTEANEPRDINVLLALDTYQGMTDAEIDLIIAYKVTREVNSQEFTAKMNAINAQSAQLVADNAAAATQAHNVLQSIVNAQLPTVPIGEPQTVSPRSIGE